MWTHGNVRAESNVIYAPYFLTRVVSAVLSQKKQDCQIAVGLHTMQHTTPIVGVTSTLLHGVTQHKRRSTFSPQFYQLSNMTPQETQKLWPFIVAFKDGKKVYRSKCQGKPELVTSLDQFAMRDDLTFSCDRWTQDRIAYAHSRKIEWKLEADLKRPWASCPTPFWSADCLYRIAPTQWPEASTAWNIGRATQYRERPTLTTPWGEWKDNKTLNPRYLGENLCIDFRVTPVPMAKYRSFTTDEIPIGKCVTSNWFDGKRMIVGTTPTTVILAEECDVEFDDFLEDCKFTDGTSCGVRIEPEDAE